MKNLNNINKRNEIQLYQKLLLKNNYINEKSLSTVLERLNMLWLQRTDRFNITESDFLIWIHNEFSNNKLQLPEKFKPKYGEEPISFKIEYSEVSSLIEKNIRKWFKNKCKLENPTFFNKLFLKLFFKD